MKDSHLESFKRLQHIAEAIASIQKYVANETIESFSSSDLTHNAVLFQFSVIGEAINFVESEILNKFDYQWYKVRSFRNFIAHEYFNINLPAIWQIIENDLPELQTVILNIINNEF